MSQERQDSSDTPDSEDSQDTQDSQDTLDSRYLLGFEQMGLDLLLVHDGIESAARNVCRGDRGFDVRDAVGRCDRPCQRERVRHRRRGLIPDAYGDTAVDAVLGRLERPEQDIRVRDLQERIVERRVRPRDVAGTADQPVTNGFWCSSENRIADAWSKPLWVLRANRCIKYASPS